MKTVTYRKWLFVSLLIIAFLFALEQKTTFASAGIQTILTNWFEGEKQESIRSLEEAINSEKETQMAILMEEISVTLGNANKELADFTAQETEKSRLELRKYTEELIQSMEFDVEGQQEEFMNEVERILEEAYGKLEQARAESLKKTE